MNTVDKRGGAAYDVNADCRAFVLNACTERVDGASDRFVAGWFDGRRLVADSNSGYVNGEILCGAGHDLSRWLSSDEGVCMASYCESNDLRMHYVVDNESPAVNGTYLHAVALPLLISWISGEPVTGEGRSGVIVGSDK